jgi:hypothetical protein
MRAFTTALFIIISFGFLFGPKTGHAQGYAGIEIYPNATAFYFGKNLGDQNNWKVDMWVIQDAELALTIGPKIGPFALGFGASVDEGSQISHLDADLTFKLFNNSKFKWSTYSLYRFGVKGNESKISSRNRLALKKADKSLPFGLIGDNSWAAGNKPNFCWGPYYDFGTAGFLSNTMLHVTFNTKNMKPTVFLMLER